MRRFVYTIVPASLIPEEVEYVFESEEELKVGDVFDRGGRPLLVEGVEDDDTGSEHKTAAISKTLHCREVELDVW